MHVVPDGADVREEEAIAAPMGIFPGAKLVSEDQADAEPIADPYHCLYCGARVTPAPASIENGWATVLPFLHGGWKMSAGYVCEHAERRRSVQCTPRSKCWATWDPSEAARQIAARSWTGRSSCSATRPRYAWMARPIDDHDCHRGDVRRAARAGRRADP